MLNVAVCDDNDIFLREARNLLRQEQRVEKITLYSDPEDLLHDISTGKESFDMVLMDIEFEEENGIRSAGEIIRLIPEVSILYMTAYNERYSQQILLGDAQPLGYMVKPLSQELLSKYIDKIYRKRGARKYLTLSIRGKEYSILTDRIRYMESQNHTVKIYLDGEELLVYDKLESILAKLPDVFVQCHKSYVVNMKRISRLDPEKVYLQGGTAIPVSRANRAHMRMAFFTYIGEEE